MKNPIYVNTQRSIFSLKYWLLLAVSLVLSPLLFGQQIKYQEDKQGKFILENHLNKCPGLDYSTLVKSATAVAEWFHQNDLLIHTPKGFDADVNMYGNLCDAIPDYGIQFEINFSFHYFLSEKGINETANDWLAHDCQIIINQPLNEIAHQFGDRSFEEGDDPTQKQAINKAHEQLQKLYSLMTFEKELAPGVSLYTGGNLLISNPNQPSPWIPVTVGEVTKVILNYYKIRKASDEYRNKKMLEGMSVEMKKIYAQGLQMSVYDQLSTQYEKLSAGDMEKPAYYVKEEGIWSINTSGRGYPVVKYNHDCWNRNLPPTSVQFISMKYKITSDNEFNQFLINNNQLKDYVGLFINSIPVEKMGELIQH